MPSLSESTPWTTAFNLYFPILYHENLIIRAAALKHRRGELVYKANLDKRVCPGCGAEQSYDEVTYDINHVFF